MNNRSIPSTHAERKNTIRSHKHSFAPYPSLSPYRQMDRMTDRGTNTLAARGLEKFFSGCAVVSVFLVLAGNSFRGYLPTIPVVPLCLFLVAAGNSFFGCTDQFFGCSGK